MGSSESVYNDTEHVVEVWWPAGLDRAHHFMPPGQSLTVNAGKHHKHRICLKYTTETNERIKQCKILDHEDMGGKFVHADDSIPQYRVSDIIRPHASIYNDTHQTVKVWAPGGINKDHRTLFPAAGLTTSFMQERKHRVCVSYTNQADKKVEQCRRLTPQEHAYKVSDVIGCVDIPSDERFFKEDEEQPESKPTSVVADFFKETFTSKPKSKSQSTKQKIDTWRLDPLNPLNPRVSMLEIRGSQFDCSFAGLFALACFMALFIVMKNRNKFRRKEVLLLPVKLGHNR